jgi:hypothetical protein
MNHLSLLYEIVKPKQTGSLLGICRITGKESYGILFNDWVKDTFTNFDQLYEGTIISNEALFTFDESSDIIKEKTNRDKPQRFRTYSHIITKNNEWLCLTKADKKKIAELIYSDNINIMCLTDTGQKHIYFKHREGFWQLDDLFVFPNIEEFIKLHSTMNELVSLGFGQEQIRTGKYHHNQILKIGISNWQNLENKISKMRGDPLFDLCAWLMYKDEVEG